MKQLFFMQLNIKEIINNRNINFTFFINKLNVIIKKEIFNVDCMISSLFMIIYEEAL